MKKYGGRPAASIYLLWKMHISMFIIYIVFIETPYTSPVTFSTNYILDHIHSCGNLSPPPPPKKINYICSKLTDKIVQGCKIMTQLRRLCFSKIVIIMYYADMLQ